MGLPQCLGPLQDLVIRGREAGMGPTPPQHHEGRGSASLALGRHEQRMQRPFSSFSALSASQQTVTPAPTCQGNQPSALLEPT